MKLSTIAFLAISSQANAHINRQLQQCPPTGTGMSCPDVFAPVACGENYSCEYANECLANSAGFVGCLPVEEVCPTPGTGMSCPDVINPVKCGSNHQCVYDNECLANGAGFVGCLPVNPPDLCNPTTGANCPPPPVNPPTPPPCNPTTGANCPPTSASMSASTASVSSGTCPTPGSGMACPTVKDPVKCGTDYQCEYDNECWANAAGFVGCLPVHEECPIAGSGLACPNVVDPVKCGTNYQCVYDNDCLANGAGFVGCLPVNPPDLCNPTTGANCAPSSASAIASASASASTASASSGTCPIPGTGMACPTVKDPVKCGTNYQCVYDNDCLANAAGFVGCLPVHEKCPIPGTGMACPAVKDPVKCGTNYQCVYDNDCLANAAGFVGCLPVNPPQEPPLCNPTTTANCPPPTPTSPPLCNPTTGANCHLRRR